MIKINVGGNELEFREITLDEGYCQKWNLRPNTQMLAIVKDDKIIPNRLYSTHSITTSDLLSSQNYFMAFKLVETSISKKDAKIAGIKNPNFINYHCCILDKYGNERYVQSNRDSVSLIGGGPIYRIHDKYYNIETGECYGQSFTYMQSADFLFINNLYHSDKSKEGVIKIDKKTGEYEIFPKK